MISFSLESWSQCTNHPLKTAASLILKPDCHLCNTGAKTYKQPGKVPMYMLCLELAVSLSGCLSAILYHVKIRKVGYKYFRFGGISITFCNSGFRMQIESCGRALEWQAHWGIHMVHYKPKRSRPFMLRKETTVNKCYLT